MAGLTGAALIGCGDDSETGGNGGAGGNGGGGGNATPANGGGTTSGAQAGGSLRVASTLEPSTLDPVHIVSGGDDVFARGMYDNLLMRDQNDEFDTSRSLAEAYEIEDETTISFTLREGVTFHDGAAFTSEDVAWNLEYLTDPEVGSVSRALFTVIERVETPDDRSIRFHLSQPNADLLVNLGDRGGMMVSRSEKERLGEEFGSRPSGTGPFVFAELASGAFLRMTKNPNYWRKDVDGNAVPYVDDLTIRVIPDGTTRAAALQTGDIEIAGVDAKDVAQMQQNPQVTMVTREGIANPSVIICNPDIHPTDNPDVRRAIQWAVNPEAVNQAVYFGLYQVADGGGPSPATWAYQPVPGRPSYDPAKAKQYLENAGYADGLEIQAITYSAPSVVQQTEIYQAQLAEIGIRLNVKTADVGSATVEFFEGGQTPVYSTAWSGRSAPDSLLRPILANGAYYNVSKQDHPEIQDLLDRAVATYDTEERRALYLELNQIVLDDAVWVPHLYSNAFAAISNRVQNPADLYYGLSSWKFQDLWLG